MKLLIQPDAGAVPIIEAIGQARKSIDIVIFRFDDKEIEGALVEAVKRNVAVLALIAFTNRGGEKRLRGLELRLLAAGAVVARTSDDLTRYHGKFMIIDRRKLYVLGFNFSRSDVERSRSFGVMTTNNGLVKEALKLFNADSMRQKYSPGLNSLLVSPVNARRGLSEFLKGAKKELLIYDVEISDRAMLKLLKERADAGVEIRVIGNVKPKSSGLTVRYSHPWRLHARVILRDRESFFLGSQSLRRLELDMRREVGVVLQDRAVAGQIAKTFEHDWESAKSADIPAEKVAKKVAKAVVKGLVPVAPVLEELAAKNGKDIEVDPEGMEQMVKEAVKNAVRDVVQEGLTPTTTTKE
jgi:phosphatidylserine/phosphatidylglycerophosphate/cardiolipin synthase-like enzyme